MDATTLARRQVARRFAEESVRRHGDDLDRIVLFGSVARGVDGPGSDIDILVVTRTRDRELETALVDLGVDFLLEDGAALGLVIYAREAYDDRRRLRLPLIQDIERDGRVLWKRNGDI